MADRSSAIDALVLILPFLVARGNFAVAASALGLFDVGAAITIFTRPPVWRSGGRQLAGRWRGPA
jgi:hypothetical protein